MAEFESFRAIAVILLPVIGAKLAVDVGLLGVSIFFFTQVLMNDKNEA